MENAPSSRLATASRQIQAFPYHPRSWLERAKILNSLCYPELAVGDAHKVILLCQGHSRERRSTLRFGYGFGFLIEDTTESQTLTASETLRAILSCTEEGARELLECIMNYNVDREEMECYYPSKVYDWIDPRHQTRSDILLSSINAESMDQHNRNQNQRTGASYEIRRYAFGAGIGSNNGAEVLGVFATQAIQEGAAVLVDKCAIWNSKGQNQQGSENTVISLEDPGTHCDFEDLYQSLDLSGPNATNILMKCRALHLTVSDPSISHPLDHPLLARLTPGPVQSKLRKLYYSHDIEIPATALQHIGIDIFANPAYDTWVLLTIFARIDNNAWDDGAGANTGVGPLFALFNHSCAPNLQWTVQKGNPDVVEVTAERDIEAGEQLFVAYNKFLRKERLKERREGLWKWLGMDCQCERCLREELEVPDAQKFTWDVYEKPTLPEDQPMMAIPKH